jgi:hypothetical protein
VTNWYRIEGSAENEAKANEEQKRKKRRFQKLTGDQKLV